MLAATLLVSSEPLHGGVTVGAKVSASAGLYNDVQRPLPLVAASPYARSYPVAAPYPVVAARYPVVRTVVVSAPQTVPVPAVTYAVPAVTRHSMQGVVGSYPYYYYPYSGYGSLDFRF